KQYGLKNIEIENENVFVSGSNGVIMKGEIDYDSVYINTYPVEKLSNTSAMLSANVASNDANVTDIYFEYGRNFTFDHADEATPDSVPAYSAENVFTAISGLDANATYQYRLKFDYQDTIIVSSVKEFTTLPDYEVTLNYPYCQFSDQVYLNGEILSRGKPINKVEFQYKKDSIFTGISAVPDSIPGDTMLNVEANITGLMQETEYLVRLKAEYANDTIYSKTYSFVTLSPYVISLYNPYINGDKVTLAGSISSYKDTIRNLGFEYGTSREYSNYIECAKSIVNPGESSQVQVELMDLDTDSIYFYRLRGEMDTSIIYSNENILSFNEEIIMIPIGVEELSDSSLRVGAYVKTNGEYVRNIQFRFGASGEFSDSVLTDPSYAIGNQIVSVSAIINRLTPDTEYCFKVRGTYNNEDIYSDQFLYTINKQSDSKKWMLTSDIEIYPNPTNGIITIRSSAKINRIELINIEGKLLKTVQNTNTMNIAIYQPGVYIIKVLAGERIIVKKVVKR
ncbi:MAG TPA: T9SS type A sorting domain-containing protein, partial [Bacteroidales bacterium]|nr:T9SS type A sorting domain-containing protein [Bacteroidales bacterium]